MSPIWKSLSRNVTGQPRRNGFRGGLPAFHGCAFSSSAMSNPYDESEEMPTAPSEKVLKIVEDISGLTLLEAADMSLLLKKKLRIQNVPVMSMGMNVMHDMWYETLPPPIGPKRMIPTRDFGEPGRPTPLSRREADSAAKVDGFSAAEYMQSASEDSDDASGYGDGFRPAREDFDDEACAEFGDEENSGKLTRKLQGANKAGQEVQDGDSSDTQTKKKKNVSKPCTKGAIPSSAKPAATKKPSTTAKKGSSDEKKSSAAEGTAKTTTSKAPTAKPAARKNNSTNPKVTTSDDKKSTAAKGTAKTPASKPSTAKQKTTGKSPEPST